MDNNYTFWMCWVEGKSNSTYRHRTMDSAQKEAERLARLNQGLKVYILKADLFALVELPLCTFSETSGIEPDRIPF
jgi:hypothetical protein